VTRHRCRAETFMELCVGYLLPVTGMCLRMSTFLLLVYRR
jgi:hypothetical protein